MQSWHSTPWCQSASLALGWLMCTAVNHCGCSQKKNHSNFATTQFDPAFISKYDLFESWFVLPMCSLGHWTLFFLFCMEMNVFRTHGGTALSPYPMSFSLLLVLSLKIFWHATVHADASNLINCFLCSSSTILSWYHNPSLLPLLCLHTLFMFRTCPFSLYLLTRSKSWLMAISAPRHLRQVCPSLPQADGFRPLFT